MTVERRKFLRMATVAPAAASQVMVKAQAKLLGSGITAALSDATALPAEDCPSPPRTFFEFAKYALHMDDRWREQARDVSNLDPDLLSMHLPLTTLVRWQRDRNYERIKARHKSWFRRVFETERKVQTWD